MSLIQALQTMNIDRMDLDEAVELYTRALAMLATYKGKRLVPPDSLEGGIEALDAYIETRRQENIKAALKRARAAKEGLRTVPERRKDVDREIEALEAELGE